VQCADNGGWEAGFVMFVDVDHNGRIGAGEPVLGIEGPAPPGITITANRPLDDYVSYTSTGHARMLNGALQMGTLTVCRHGQRAQHVVLANSGRVRTERTTDLCP
jgi:type IV fimbrial biogenesis protein FimT